MKQDFLFPGAKGHLGTDESGKGDYFGPLVVAGLFLPEGQEAVLAELGVRDSKKFSDARVQEMAQLLQRGYTYSLVVIGPEKYNALYAKMKNLNRLLAWAHARVIENILEKVDCRRVITDQFGDKIFVLNALMKKGRQIELIQKPKAEEDMAVAAASILARAEFLRRLYFLSQEIGLDLPKGASAKVEEVAYQLVKEKGQAILNRVAKVHFKTTQKVLALLTTENDPD
ncbi:MAG: ribonuclease HIII [Candidatus Aminicenantes bacterium]|nr:MAG: ribonuclease HIII [Candidatus Aminicenantes bacterium]